MNDENDKPKDDGWGMTMPHLRYEEKKKTDEFADECIPKSKQTSPPPDNEWGMTTPNINLSNDRSSSSAFDKTTPNINIQQDIWDDESPSAHQPPAVWDATAPNVHVPQNFSDDDWGMDAPNPTTPPKKSDWSMPAPVFRVSEGEDIDDIKRTAAFNLSDLKGFDKDSMTFLPGAPESPTFNQPAPNIDFQTTPPPVVPNNFSVPPPIPESFPESQTPAPVVVQSEKKKASKAPLVVGGLLGMLLFAGVFLGGVYYLFFNKTTETASAVKTEPDVLAEPNNTPSSSLTSAPLPPRDLPKQIEYKGAMLLISAGEFTMGSDRGADDAKPAHKVSLPAYYIDKMEVTNAEYKAFCDATGKTYPPNPHLEADYFTKRPNAPVVGVSFADAKAYADWAGKRLPTEAEWEKAASWDEATAAKREFPWGNDFQKDKVAFETGKISDVGKFSGGASPAGALDMAGNVLEWVDAYFQPYPNGSSANSEFGEKNRVVRGGHFASKSPDSLKTTKRIYIPPTVASGEDDEKLMAAIIGFRCAVSADDSRIADVLSAQGK
jgi:formylglycine-generating enzyme required for sulfatase activity